MSYLFPVFITCRAGVRPFAGQVCRALGLGTAEFLQRQQTLIGETNLCVLEPTWFALLGLGPGCSRL